MENQKRRMEQDILVVTATLGNRDSLEKTVESVAQHGGGRVKHVIIAPSDKYDVLKIKYPHLEILAEPNSCKGIYMALNFALLKYANDYEYLTFINDDDYWLPNYKELIKELDSNKIADVVYGKVNFIDENDVLIYEQASSGRYKSFKKLLSQNIVLFTQQATIMRSSLFLNLKGFSEDFKLVSDTLFWIKAIESGAVFIFKNSICAAYTIQLGQLSSDTSLQEYEHAKLISEKNTKFYLESLLEKMIFRCSNLNLYLKRLQKYKSLRSKTKS
jgi:hypothetical protein